MTERLFHLFNLLEFSMCVKSCLRLLFFLTTSLISLSALSATPLEKAAKYGDLDEVKTLIEQGADVNQVDEDSIWAKTPLFVAAEKGHEQVVSYLLEHGADPSIANGASATPLRTAAYKGHAKIVRLLLKHGAKPDEDKDYSGRTPMIWAILGAKKGDTENFVDIIRALHEFGATCEKAFTHPVNDSSVSVAETAQESGAEIAKAYAAACGS